ncbi:hypothetical protein BTO02_04945 [Paraburkholderia sp. SOS3]|nr:hypothetical protein BTO02_04945 [Paraburkholderia sp. SOS3]
MAVPLRAIRLRGLVEEWLAFYMGYAFRHAMLVQHRLAPGELSVPYVVHRENETPTRPVSSLLV